MATSTVMLRRPLSELVLQSLEGPDYQKWVADICGQDVDYLKWVSDIVSTHKGKTYKLNSPAGATWSVGDFNDTMYKDDNEMVYEWENLYLEEEVSMQVLGVVEGTSIPGEELVLMTCKDGKLYIYGERELSLVAPSLEHLCKQGIDDPPSVTFDFGDALKNMTNKDWDRVRKGPVGKQLDEKHHQLMMSLKSDMMRHLPMGIRHVAHHIKSCM